jgi:hypothetical protein
MQDNQHSRLLDGERYITRIILLVVSGIMVMTAIAAMIAYE